MDALETDNTYHVFNRGANKADVFIDDYDRGRFQALLHLGNHSEPVHMSNVLSRYRGKPFTDVFSEPVDHALVDIYSYSLMSNHFHLVLRQRSHDGISRYMKKLMTAYSMYFNARHDHSGTLFQGRFRSSLVANEPYFRWIFSYVHLNALSLLYPNWEEKGVSDIEAARQFMRGYAFSSFSDYTVGQRPESTVLAMSSAPDFLTAQNDLEDMLKNIKDRPL